MWQAILNLLGKLATLWLAYQQGKKSEAAKLTEKALEEAREIKRQDDIVHSGDVDSMRTKLSDALRRKRDS